MRNSPDGSKYPDDIYGEIRSHLEEKGANYNIITNRMEVLMKQMIISKMNYFMRFRIVIIDV